MDMNKLAHFEALHVLKARYCRLCDTRDWDGLFELFTEDAVFGEQGAEPSDPNDQTRKYKAGYQVGRAAIRQTFVTMAAALSEMVHQCFAPELELTSATTAKGIWGFEDRLYFKEGPIALAHGFGHYHDTYVLDSGVWRIKTCVPVRLRVETLPR